MNIETTSHGRIIVGDLLPMTPPEAFALAEKICAAAYVAQGGPAKDPDERDQQQTDRRARSASSFEELYCAIKDIADDWHRESIRRRDGKESGAFDADYLDEGNSFEPTARAVLEHIKNWDY